MERNLHTEMLSVQSGKAGWKEAVSGYVILFYRALARPTVLRGGHCHKQSCMNLEWSTIK